MESQEEESPTLLALIGLEKVLVTTWTYIMNISRAQKTKCLALC